MVLPALIDVSDQGEPGLRELVMKAENMIKDHAYLRLAKAINEFNYHLAKDDGLALYGENDVRKALDLGAVKFIIIVSDHEKVDEFTKIAKERGADVYVIDSKVPEYAWIKKTFNGLVAVLRYQLYLL